MNLPLLLRASLYPVSLVYEWFVRRRARLYAQGKRQRKRLKAAVVSVGNLTVGGTGKTPMVLWLAEKFATEGKKVAILSRGYRGSNGTSDELELLKRRLGSRAVFGVGPDRYATGRELESERPIDVFLLDDGFQHLQLARDLDILMLDGSRSLNKQWLLPAGPLREPISACERADLVVVSRKLERPEIAGGHSHSQAIFYAQTRLLGFRRLNERADSKYLSRIGPGPFFAFCGIGNPEAFFADLERWEMPLAGRRSYRDHYKYSRSDVADLRSAAERAGAMGLVTTEKDAQNLPHVEPHVPVWICVIDFVFPSESELHAVIDRKLAGRWGARA